MSLTARHDGQFSLGPHFIPQRWETRLDTFVGRPHHSALLAESVFCERVERRHTDDDMRTMLYGRDNTPVRKVRSYGIYAPKKPDQSLIKHNVPKLSHLARPMLIFSRASLSRLPFLCYGNSSDLQPLGNGSTFACQYRMASCRAERTLEPSVHKGFSWPIGRHVCVPMRALSLTVDGCERSSHLQTQSWCTSCTK